MSVQVVTKSEQVTPQWLTSILKAKGALEHGRVENVTFDGTERPLSTNLHLRLTYSVDASGKLPEKLFLKMVNTDQEDEFFGESEVTYYTEDYVGVKGVPIPPVYDAQYSEVQGRYHILMDDLSDTHIEAQQKPPSLEYGYCLAEGLAAMHAQYWGAQRLDNSKNEPIPDAKAIMRFVNMGRNGAEHIIKGAGHELKPHGADSMREIYAKHPAKMIERTRLTDGFTLIHGDPNGNNILVPIEGHQPLYIIDRQPFDWSLTVWLGVYDLVYATMLEWSAEFRRKVEEPILRHYHAHLLENGVTGYLWEQLYDDYRLCIGMGVYIATEYCRSNYSERYYSAWMPMLQRTLTAFDDLECGQLLE